MGGLDDILAAIANLRRSSYGTLVGMVHLPSRRYPTYTNICEESWAIFYT